MSIKRFLKTELLGAANRRFKHHLEVSRRIREEFENGRDYYALHGKELRVPQNKDSWPEVEYLNWHNENVFLR